MYTITSFLWVWLEKLHVVDLAKLPFGVDSYVFTTSYQPFCTIVQLVVFKFVRLLVQWT